MTIDLDTYSSYASVSPPVHTIYDCRIPDEFTVMFIFPDLNVYMHPTSSSLFQFSKSIRSIDTSFVRFDARFI